MQQSNLNCKKHENCREEPEGAEGSEGEIEGITNFPRGCARLPAITSLIYIALPYEIPSVQEYSTSKSVTSRSEYTLTI